MEGIVKRAKEADTRLELVLPEMVEGEDALWVNLSLLNCLTKPVSKTLTNLTLLHAPVPNLYALPEASFPSLKYLVLSLSLPNTTNTEPPAANLEPIRAFEVAPNLTHVALNRTVTHIPRGAGRVDKLTFAICLPFSQLTHYLETGSAESSYKLVTEQLSDARETLQHLQLQLADGDISHNVLATPPGHQSHVDLESTPRPQVCFPALESLTLSFWGTRLGHLGFPAFLAHSSVASPSSSSTTSETTYQAAPFPALKSLRIEASNLAFYDLSPESTLDLLTFLHNLPTSLCHLSLCVPKVSLFSLRSILDALPTENLRSVDLQTQRREVGRVLKVLREGVERVERMSVEVEQSVDTDREILDAFVVGEFVDAKRRGETQAMMKQLTVYAMDEEDVSEDRAYVKALRGREGGGFELKTRVVGKEREGRTEWAWVERDERLSGWPDVALLGRI